MSPYLGKTIAEICEAEGRGRHRLLPIAKLVQEKFGCVSEEAIDSIAGELGIPGVTITIDGSTTTVTDLYGGVVRTRQFNEFFSLFDAVGKGFFDQYGLALLDKRPGDIEMTNRRRGDDRTVDHLRCLFR